MRVVAGRSGDSLGLGDRLVIEVVDVQILRRTRLRTARGRRGGPRGEERRGAPLERRKPEELEDEREGGGEAGSRGEEEDRSAGEEGEREGKEGGRKARKAVGGRSKGHWHRVRVTRNGSKRRASGANLREHRAFSPEERRDRTGGVLVRKGSADLPSRSQEPHEVSLNASGSLRVRFGERECAVPPPDRIVPQEACVKIDPRGVGITH